jgi:hypothetical protein
MGNFRESLEDISAALRLNDSPALIPDLLRIQNRVRVAASLDEKALKEETVPVSYVTSNQSLRFNFGASYLSEVSSHSSFRIRLNVTNEFGLWNRAHLTPPSSSLHPSPVTIQVQIIPMSDDAKDLIVTTLSDSSIGPSGRVSTDHHYLLSPATGRAHSGDQQKAACPTL